MRLKRQICLMTLFMMCIFGCCQFVYAEEAETPVEFEYTIYESRNEVHLEEYTGDNDATEVVIPDMIEGVPVTYLGRELFADMQNLEKVVLPSGLIEIAGGAFDGCISLKTMEGFRDDVEYILVNAPVSETFGDTPWYQNKVEEAGNKPVMIGTTVYDLTHCSGAVTIPKGATTIPEVALQEKYNEKTRKTAVEITSILLPATMTDVQCEQQIAGIETLKAVKVNTENERYYGKNGVLFDRYAYGMDEEKTVELVIYPAQKTNEMYEVPASVKRIRCVRSQHLTTVTFASNYKKSDYVDLLDYAFAGCKKLKKITLPTYCHLSKYIFKGTAITNLYLPKGVSATTSSMGVMAFSGMSKMEKISVSDKHEYYFVSNGALMSDYDEKQLLVYPAAKTGKSLTIPAGTKKAFLLNEAKNLKTIVVPTSTKKIILTTKRMKSIYTIKYRGTKAQWKDVYVGGYTTEDGEYIGECLTEFTMNYNCKSLSDAKVTIPKKSYKYTGKAIKPTVTVKMGDTKLKKGTHYTVTYSNNKKKGTAKITITGKGKYYGTRTKTFKIVK